MGAACWNKNSLSLILFDRVGANSIRGVELLEQARRQADTLCVYRVSDISEHQVITQELAKRICVFRRKYMPDGISMFAIDLVSPDHHIYSAC